MTFADTFPPIDALFSNSPDTVLCQAEAFNFDEVQLLSGFCAGLRLGCTPGRGPAAPARGCVSQVSSPPPQHGLSCSQAGEHRGARLAGHSEQRNHPKKSQHCGERTARDDPRVRCESRHQKRVSPALTLAGPLASGRPHSGVRAGLGVPGAFRPVGNVQIRDPRITNEAPRSVPMAFSPRALFDVVVLLKRRSCVEPELSKSP